MIKINITDISLKTIIGTKKEERERPQELIASIIYEYDADRAIRSDDLNQAVDYETLTNRIIKRAEGTKFFLLEKLADDILMTVLKDKKIKNATVRIYKPRSIEKAKEVLVELKGSN